MYNSELKCCEWMWTSNVFTCAEQQRVLEKTERIMIYMPSRQRPNKNIGGVDIEKKDTSHILGYEHGSQPVNIRYAPQDRGYI